MESSAHDGNTRAATASADSDVVLESGANSGNEEEVDNIIRSRDKSDSWHKMYNTPLPKDFPVSPFVFKLLHQATRAIDEVAEKKMITVLSGKGITNFDEHFFFNKEFWYKRVRMPF